MKLSKLLMCAFVVKKVIEYDQKIPQLHCRPMVNHGTLRKSHITLTVTSHQDNSNKTTSSLFPIKMIVKLERIKCTA